MRIKSIYEGARIAKRVLTGQERARSAKRVHTEKKGKSGVPTYIWATGRPWSRFWDTFISGTENPIDKRSSTSLTFAGTRHFAILHGTGGGRVMRPPSRLAPEWARAPIQKPACCLSRDEGFKVLGQPVTSEVRSMTQKWPKCDFADNFVSEQARAAIQRPERSLRSYEYYAMPFGPLRSVGVQILTPNIVRRLRTMLGVKIKKS